MRGSFISFSAMLITLGFVGSSVLASIPQKFNKSPIEKILAEKNDGKFKELRRLGPHVYGDLRKLAFDSERALGIRWQAFMALVRLGEKESLPEINAALQSQEWFLKDAALRVLPVLDPGLAYRAAMAKLDDSALVVRTAAVDVLAEVKNSKCSEKLWGQLYSKENYIKHQSLWIRRHIVEALAEVAPMGSEEKFMKVLDDADSSLFAPAIKGLERLTGKKLGDSNLPPVYRRYFWKKWYAEKIKKS